jgi:hypothetical protein
VLRFNLCFSKSDLGGRAKYDSREGGGTSSRMSEGRTMQELLSRAKHDSREGGGRAKQDARAEEAKTEQFSVQNGLIFREPQATQSGCRYSGRPALSPSDQQSCSKLLQAILIFRLLERYYGTRKTKACETIFRAGAKYERGCRANARNDSKRLG